MRIVFTAVIAFLLLAPAFSSNSAHAQSKDDAKDDKSAKSEGFRPEQQKSTG